MSGLLYIKIVFLWWFHMLFYSVFISQKLVFAWYSISVERLGIRQNKRREVVSLIVVNYALIDSNQPITKIWKRKWKPPSFSIVYLYQLVAVCLYYVAVAEQVDALVLPKDTSKGRSLAQIRVGIMQGANPCQRL